MFASLRKLLHSRAAYPPAPEGRVIYAIGDVHGQFDLLCAVQAAIDADAANLAGKRIVEIYLGDYVDRGPQARQVIENLIARAIAHGRTRLVVVLKGNHEAALLDFVDGRIALDAWVAFGAALTLRSYGVAADQDDEDLVRNAFAQNLGVHRRFLEGLPAYSVFGDYLFVHAGLRPDVPIEEQSERDLLWIRDEFLHFRGSFGPIVVHGHTPVEEVEFCPNRINIDTGAYATRQLTCLRIDGDGPRVLPAGPSSGAL